ncbi:YkgJ family cysteine cluster protein [Haloparvum alkalitolerans]|uniref:YkgJ family cysteine cluster protein n=1 Tax=Haloparvum alkalitolerans TaxID=1042953 RepID=UPI003CF119C2
METNCEGCAGCCVDWRALADRPVPDRTGRRNPLDDTYDLVPLTRDEVAAFVDDGLGDALVPRLFAPAEGDDSVTVDGHDLAAIDGRPVFIVGLRKPPKAVGPFDAAPRWLPTCVFLDPDTLQCRIHGSERYPQTCATYPGHNLRLERETECERVEDAFGGDRLTDGAVPEDLPPPQFGPTALGSTVFAHPDPDALEGTVARLAAAGRRAGVGSVPGGDPETPPATAADRGTFVGAAVGSRPMSLSVNRDRMAEARAAVESADSWVGRALDEWTERAAAAGGVGVPADDPGTLAREVEDRRGAPGTPGW